MKKALIFIFVFLFLLGLAWGVKRLVVSKPTLVTVVGEGRATAEPSEVRFVVLLVSQGASPAEAINGEKKTLTETVSLLKRYGINKEDIKTSYLRVNPIGLSLTETPFYQASQAISVSLTQVNRFEEIVEQLYNLGVRAIEGVQFTTADDQALEKRAVAAAIADVEARAKELARTMKRRLGRMVSLRTEEIGGAGTGVSKVKLAEGEMPQTKEIEISRQAVAVFELK